MTETTPTAQAILEHIHTNKLLDVPVSWADELIFPYFDGFSIVNLANTILSLLGVEDTQTPLNTSIWQGETPQDIERVVLFISDGLGYHYLNQLTDTNNDIHDYVSELSGGRDILPLTSILPSTTVSALPTLWTGVAPGTHGIVGTHMFLKEVSMLCNMLRFTPSIGRHPTGILEEWGVSGKEFVTVPSLAQRLSTAGVKTTSIMERNLVGSGLSKILHRGVKKHHSHRSTAEMWVRMREALAKTRGNKSYVCIYVDHIDKLSHEYGAHNVYTASEVKHQLAQLHSLLNDPALRDGKTLVIISADHGHYDVPHAISVEAHPDLAPLREAMRYDFGGEGRFGTFALRAGTKYSVIEHINSHFAESLACIDVETALQAGMFGDGPFYPQLRHRLGDVIITTRAGYCLTDRQHQFHSVSRHGGMNQWEMLVPFLWKRL